MTDASGKEPEADLTELVIGLVGAVGANLDALHEALRAALATLDFETEPIHLIKWVQNCDPWKGKVDPKAPYDKRISAKIDIGNAFCLAYDEKDGAEAFARMAVVQIRDRRGRNKGWKRVAFVLHQLKRPEEVKVLRSLYGNNFWLLGAYEPREHRIENLAEEIRRSMGAADSRQFEGRAVDLVTRDACEHGRKFGQNVQMTFSKCDAFFDTSDKKTLKVEVERFVQALFRHPCVTPTLNEFAMAQAYTTSLRSSAGRQVGACILARSGEVIALGANEVPRPGGGQRFASDGDASKRKDLDKAIDSNDEMINDILLDLVKRLAHHEWLKPELCAKDADALVKELNGRILEPLEDKESSDPLAQLAYIHQVIEYLRAVHAEMAALTSAARYGRAVRGATLYTTTFPCHECARHIVAAGIKKVVFIEPYPKSRAERLYSDAVAVDEDSHARVPFKAFVGVAPRAYAMLFEAPPRVDKAKERLNWEAMDLANQQPRGALRQYAYEKPEKDLVTDFALRFRERPSLVPRDTGAEVMRYVEERERETSNERATGPAQGTATAQASLPSAQSGPAPGQP